MNHWVSYKFTSFNLLSPLPLPSLLNLYSILTNLLYTIFSHPFYLNPLGMDEGYGEATNQLQ